MDKKKLNAKDFINIGIFTVIYFVMFFHHGYAGLHSYLCSDHSIGV